MDQLVHAALSLQVTSKSTFRILPAGQFKASDGRPAAGSWVLTPAMGEALVLMASMKRGDYPIDYEHQTVLADKNGMPAPAAGWFKRLEWREDGLYTTDARWTDRAKAMIDAGEYRYISPVFLFDPQTLEVRRLLNVALTNMPALPYLTDLAALTHNGSMHQLGKSRGEELLDRILSQHQG